MYCIMYLILKVLKGKICVVTKKTPNILLYFVQGFATQSDILCVSKIYFVFTKQGTYFKKLEKLLESSLNLATSNEKDMTESKENSQNGTPSAKKKLAMFAYTENKNGTNTDESTNKEKLKVDEKKHESNGHDSMEENEVEASGIKKEVDDDEKMDTEDSAPSPPQKKQTKGESDHPFPYYGTHIDILHQFHNLLKPHQTVHSGNIITTDQDERENTYLPVL